MAEPVKKRPIIRRIIEPIGNRYEAVPDAVNETLIVNGVPLRIQAQLMQIGAEQAQAQALERAKVQARANYRNRKKAQQNQARQESLVFELPVDFMSDQAIDAAIAQEQRDAQLRANQPQLSQGYDRPKVDNNKLADLYAAVSNFYTSLGSPNMMPLNTALVQANPQVAAQLLNFGLNNPALTVLQVATPTGPSTGAFGAAKTAFQSGMQATMPLATRVVTATGQAARAGGRALALNAPKLVGNAVVLGVPASASAAVTAGDGGGASNSYMPAILGTAATIGLGYGGYKGYKLVRQAGGNWRVLLPTKSGAAIRAAAKAPVSETALVPYTGLYLKPDWFGMRSWWERPVTTAEKAGLPKPTIGLRVGALVRNWGVRAPLYYTVGSGVIGGGLDLLQKGRHPEKANEWFWTLKLTYPSLGVPRDIGNGILGTMDQIQYGDSTKVENSPEMLSALKANLDNVRLVPAFTNASMYPTIVNVDSLNAVAAGIPYVPQK